MTQLTEYYGAELQDVQVQIAIAVINPVNTSEIRTIYAFSQKVLADTYIVKSTQPANSSIKSSTISAELNYTPIMLQLGRGGPNISDPVSYVKNLYPGYNVSDAKYDNSNLITVKTLTNITSSPAANLIEVTATYSLIISAATIYMTATPK
jgi:hypothetical protein